MTTFDERRAGIGACWSLGEYDELARRLMPAAEAVAALAGDGEINGHRGTAVDLAAGNGTPPWHWPTAAGR